MADIKMYDVIIVGGGLTGLTAAREMHQMGYTPLVVEAKDRLGGRTWTSERLGTNLELGAGWVHWVQPHIWSELTRYNIGITPSPEPEKAYWITGNRVVTGDPEKMAVTAKTALEELFSSSRELFPRPYAPHYSSKIEEIDKQSVLDKLNNLDITKEEYDLLHGRFSTMFNGPVSKGAFTQLLRWYALSSHDVRTLAEMTGTYKMVGGTKSLIDSLVKDAPVDMRCSTPVSDISSLGNKIKVTAENGEIQESRAVVCTVPFKALRNITFTPSLSEEKQKVAQEGQTSKGIKVWAKVEGRMESYIAFAPGDRLLTQSKYEYDVDGDSIVVALGPDGTLLDPDNTKEIEQALQQWFPKIKVKESTGHNWTEDPFIQETWPMLQTNQLTKSQQKLREPEHGIFLAGSNYSNGWTGFMDGAIQDGIEVSHKIKRYLKH
ncbi:flavin monoamine oxidase family protein [Salibacterium sp. K-3]